MTLKQFEEAVTRGAQPVIVQFLTTWCGACRVLEPRIEELVTRCHGRLGVLSVDIDREPELAERYRVQWVPTLILFRDGAEVRRCTGASRAERFLSALASMVAGEAEVS